MPSGSEAYAKLYPEKSSDNVLRLGNVVPGELQLPATSSAASVLQHHSPKHAARHTQLQAHSAELGSQSLAALFLHTHTCNHTPDFSADTTVSLLQCCCCGIMTACS